jgi:hypothetical protein
MGCPCSLNGLHHKVLWRRLALRMRGTIYDHYYINIKVKYKERKYKDREYKSKKTAAGQPHRERRFGFCAPYAEQVEIAYMYSRLNVRQMMCVALGKVFALLPKILTIILLGSCTRTLKISGNRAFRVR